METDSPAYPPAEHISPSAPTDTVYVDMSAQGQMPAQACGGVGPYPVAATTIYVPMNYDNSDSSPTFFYKITTKNDKNRFLAKIFSCITALLLLNGVEIAFLYGIDSVRNYVHENIWPMIVAIVCVVVFVILALCFKKKKVPGMTFTVLFALSFGFILATFASYFDIREIVMAMVITVCITAACTFYALFFNVDFKLLWMIVTTLSIVAIAMFICGFAIGFQSWWRGALCCLMAVIFSIYIIVDVAVIRLEDDEDEWIFHVINCYTDIAILFMYILSFLGHAK